MNAYKVLQVDKDAEHEVIDAAYRRLAAKYHPDKDQSPAATERMKQINAAYELIRDPDRRAEYDISRKRARRVVADQAAHAPREPVQPPQHDVSYVNDAVERAAVAASRKVLGKILWIAAFFALAVYLPWGLAILVAGWALVRLFKKYPKGFARALQWGFAAATVVGIYAWRQNEAEVAERQRRERELAELDIRTLLAEELGTFAASCKNKARLEAPQLAEPYCECLVNAIRSNFDDSSILAYSVADYRIQFASRFTAAAPSTTTQRACARQVTPAAPLAATAAMKQPRPTGTPRAAPRQVAPEIGRDWDQVHDPGDRVAPIAE